MYGAKYRENCANLSTQIRRFNTPKKKNIYGKTHPVHYFPFDEALFNVRIQIRFLFLCYEKYFAGRNRIYFPFISDTVSPRENRPSAFPWEIVIYSRCNGQHVIAIRANVWDSTPPPTPWYHPVIRFFSNHPWTNTQ